MKITQKKPSLYDSKKLPKKLVRCAVYTRKSREEGLEQDFNSLHAQRAAAENYIASQENEGWKCSPKIYDDGGFSGGNIERPALENLFKDIRKREIDVIVVYKIDRLTRSLLDFSKIVDFLNQYDVAFVSVTEHFNSATSTGRLMLNMLLSFAQYERELTSERIRDKFAASSARGIWMGGPVPLGYDVKDRKLLINEAEAKTVKHIFHYFLEVHSLSDVARDLNQKGLKTKSWTSQSDRFYPGKKFCKSSIRRILDNPIYAGKIKHKDKVYEGQHEAIISHKVWKETQEYFHNDTKQIIKPSTRLSEPPLLLGKFECAVCAKAMTSTYTQKKNKRYRYYVCSGTNQACSEACELRRMPAKEVEQVVIGNILSLLKKPEIIAKTISATKGEIDSQEIISRFKNIQKIWDDLFPVEQSRIINLLVQKIYITNNILDIRIHSEGLSSLNHEIGVAQ